MIQIKPGVNMSGLRPEMAIVISIAESVIQEFEPAVGLVITSALDGKHSRASLHYVGFALDFRTRELPEELKISFADELRIALGRQYDVVLEKTHLHVEFQPKK